MGKKILSTQRNRIYRIFKDSLECCTCGYNQDSSALEFHHIVPMNKLEEIPKLISIGDYDLILDELSKCAVICSNCHNIIHNSTKIELVIQITKSLVQVNTTYFKELCEILNALIPENVIEEIDEQNIETLIHTNVSDYDFNKEQKIDILKKHLANLYDGVKISTLNKSKLANEIKLNRVTMLRYIDELTEQGLLSDYIDKNLLLTNDCF